MLFFVFRLGHGYRLYNTYIAFKMRVLSVKKNRAVFVAIFLLLKWKLIKLFDHVNMQYISLIFYCNLIFQDKWRRSSKKINTRSDFGWWMNRSDYNTRLFQGLFRSFNTRSLFDLILPFCCFSFHFFFFWWLFFGLCEMARP